MGIYFCRVGTDDGADTEPTTGSEVQAGRAAACSARVSVNRGNSARFHDSNGSLFWLGFKPSFFQCSRPEFVIKTSTTGPSSSSSSSVFTCFSSLRQMMDLSGQKLHRLQRRPYVQRVNSRKWNEINAELGKRERNIHVSRDLMIRTWCPSRDPVLTNSTA